MGLRRGYDQVDSARGDRQLEREERGAAGLLDSEAGRAAGGSRISADFEPQLVRRQPVQAHRVVGEEVVELGDTERLVLGRQGAGRGAQGLSSIRLRFIQ